MNYYPTTSAQETKQTYLIMMTWANSLMVKGIERNKHLNMLTWANTLMAKGITRSDIFFLFFLF